jgi:hypothetical protein
MKFLSMFKESDGTWSMRRVLAFLFSCAGIAAGIISAFAEVDWKIVTACFGVPGLIALAFLILTTVSEVKEIVSAVRKQTP